MDSFLIGGLTFPHGQRSFIKIFIKNFPRDNICSEQEDKIFCGRLIFFFSPVWIKYGLNLSLFFIHTFFMSSSPLSIKERKCQVKVKGLQMQVCTPRNIKNNQHYHAKPVMVKILLKCLTIGRINEEEMQ